MRILFFILLFGFLIANESKQDNQTLNKKIDFLDIETELAKYGVNFEDFHIIHEIENERQTIEKEITTRIKHYYPSEYFSVSIELLNQKMVLYDSTVVKIEYINNKLTTNWLDESKQPSYQDDYNHCSYLSTPIFGHIPSGPYIFGVFKSQLYIKIYLSNKFEYDYGLDSTQNIMSDSFFTSIKEEIKRYLQYQLDEFKIRNIDSSLCDEHIVFEIVDEIIEIEKPSISLTRDDIYDDSWAVIIGIDNYQNLTNLDYAVEDAKAVKELLITKFDYSKENIKLLLNEEANKTNIVNVISDVSLKAGENDRILVFYAGHGETMPLPEGGEMGYLIPIDGNQENLFASSIPMDDLRDLSNMSKSKHMLFLIDACYGGLAAVGSRGLEPAKTPNYLEKISNIKSRQIITAGGKDEIVFEKSEWGHSVYTKNLLSALEDGLADSNEDGYITADELGDYLSEKVSIDSENQQTPQSRRLTSHEGEFIFVYSENESVIQDKSDDMAGTSDYDPVVIPFDIVEKKAIDEQKNWFEKYGYEGHGIGFLAFEDFYMIGFQENMSKNWILAGGYMHIGNNSIEKLLTFQNSISGTANVIGLSLRRQYYITDKIAPYIMGVTDYIMVSWKDAEQNTSGDFNHITYGLGFGVALHPFQFKYPFPMYIGIQVGCSLFSFPTTLKFEGSQETLDNWKIKLMPVFSFIIGIPG